MTSIAIPEQKYPQFGNFGKAYACKKIIYFSAGKTRANLCDATCFSTVGNNWCNVYIAQQAKLAYCNNASMKDIKIILCERD